MKLALFACMFLAGCCFPPKKPDVVNVPVAVKCKASEVEVNKPASYPFTDSAKTDMDIYEKTKLLLAEVSIRAAYEIQLEQIKKACTE